MSEVVRSELIRSEVRLVVALKLVWILLLWETEQDSLWVVFL